MLRGLRGVSICAMLAAVPTFVGAPLAAFAQDASVSQGPGFIDQVKAGATKTGAGAGLTNVPPLEDLIGGIINAVLGFLGVLLLGYIIYAGFIYMTAGGDKTKTQTAMTMIKNAIIGLVIIMASYAITVFVLSRLAATQASVSGSV